MPEVTSTVITDAMLSGLVTMVSDNVAAILPSGLQIMAVIIGVGLIPRIVYKFL